MHALTYQYFEILNTLILAMQCMTVPFKMDTTYLLAGATEDGAGTIKRKYFHVIENWLIGT